MNNSNPNGGAYSYTKDPNGYHTVAAQRSPTNSSQFDMFNANKTNSSLKQRGMMENSTLAYSGDNGFNSTNNFGAPNGRHGSGNTMNGNCFGSSSKFPAKAQQFESIDSMNNGMEPSLRIKTN